MPSPAGAAKQEKLNATARGEAGLTVQADGWWKRYETDSVPSTQSINHQKVAFTQWVDRMDPLQLGQFFFQEGERLCHPEFKPILCKAMYLEKGRQSTKDAGAGFNKQKKHYHQHIPHQFWKDLTGRALDVPLEEVAGRYIIITNMRILIVDSSYIESGPNKERSHIMKEDQVIRHHIGYHSAMLHPDVVKAKFSQTFNAANKNNTGWKKHYDPLRSLAYQAANLNPHRAGQQGNMGIYKPGGPSATLPLTMGQPAESCQTTVDYTYFRSIPLSAVLDYRMDFVSAAKTTATNVWWEPDLRGCCRVLYEATFSPKGREPVDVCPCSKGTVCHTLSGPIVRVWLPFLSLGASLLASIPLYMNGEDTQWNNPVGKDAYGFAVFFSCVLLFVALPRGFWMWVRRKCCPRKVTEMDTLIDRRRMIMFRTVNNGTVVLDISHAHPAGEIMAAIKALLEHSRQFTHQGLLTADYVNKCAKEFDKTKREFDHLRHELQQLHEEVDRLAKCQIPEKPHTGKYISNKQAEVVKHRYGKIVKASAKKIKDRVERFRNTGKWFKKLVEEFAVYKNNYLTKGNRNIDEETGEVKVQKDAEEEDSSDDESDVGADDDDTAPKQPGIATRWCGYCVDLMGLAACGACIMTFIYYMMCRCFCESCWPSGRTKTYDDDDDDDFNTGEDASPQS